jgi:hypothetical protein
MLLSNNPGLTRVASCLYEVSNVYNLKSYNGDLTRMRQNMPKSDELLFTQVTEWPESRQNFQMLRHSNGKILHQRSRFYALWIKKVDGNFYLRIASDWFIKFDGEEKLGVQLDYDYIQKRWKMGVMLRAEQRVKKLIAKRKQERLEKKQAQEKYEKRKEQKRLAEARRRVRLRAEKLKIKTDRRASIVPKLTSKAKPKLTSKAKPKAAPKLRAQKAKQRVPKRKRGKALCKLAIDKSKERDEHAKRVRRPDKPGLPVAC